MNPIHDTQPDPTEERKHRIMDAQEIAKQLNQRERRIAEEEERGK